MVPQEPLASGSYQQDCCSWSCSSSCHQCKMWFPFIQVSESYWDLTGTYCHLSVCGATGTWFRGGCIIPLSNVNHGKMTHLSESFCSFGDYYLIAFKVGAILSISRALQAGLGFSGCWLFFYFVNTERAAVRWVITDASFKALLHVAIH